MQLTPHFALHEFTRSDTARRHGLSNTPSPEHLDNLKFLAGKLELIRSALDDCPIIITSGYRSPAVNKLVGGVPNSSHALGLAADLIAPSFGSVREVCEAIEASGVEFDQLIFEQGTYSEWVHLGFDERMRGEVLSWSPRRGYARGIRDMS